jgi:hypothetical protein
MRRNLPTSTTRPYRSLPFFNQLPTRDQELMLLLGTELIVPPGTVVASSACGGRQCTLLLSGSLTWSEPDMSGGLHPIRCLRVGDFLDEEALSWACATEDGPGAFWVHAATDTRILVFHRTEYKALVHRAPSIGALVELCTAVHLSTWRPQTGHPSPGYLSGEEVTDATESVSVNGFQAPDVWSQDSPRDSNASSAPSTGDSVRRQIGGSPGQLSDPRRTDSRSLSRWLITAIGLDGSRAATVMPGSQPGAG